MSQKESNISIHKKLLSQIVEYEHNHVKVRFSFFFFTERKLVAQSVKAFSAALTLKCISAKASARKVMALTMMLIPLNYRSVWVQETSFSLP